MPAPGESVFVEQPADVPRASAATFRPVRIPVRPVGTRNTSALPTSHLALAETNVGLIGQRDPSAFEPGPGEDEEASEPVFVESTDRVQKVAIETHGFRRRRNWLPERTTGSRSDDL